MAKPSEEISKYNSNSSGKTDANLANDTLHLGGIPADEWATKRFVQQYHDNKEEILREYIDTQDLAKLQEAKNYVDTAIRNQDFSTFAKLTDLQALSATLTARIEECARNCANNLNTRIQAVVADTNANFSNVNTSIQQLNANDEQLFQSVSSGKRKVAAAITDKGVNTASNATFDTMASNIRKIETGGGDYDENFVNTGDATATANDIFLGKTAYVKGQKVYGTYSDYYPTTGTDTSSGNVTASDIPWGKIAFSGGQAITGTGYTNPNVEEIYAANPNSYVLNPNSVCMGKDPNSENSVTFRYCAEFSKDSKYCVSGVKLNNSSNETDFYIESHMVNENGLVIQGSSGVTEGSIIYKKYRYTKTELGIDANEELKEISLGAAGLCGYADRCLLMIRTNLYLHFYTYHLSENGVIGKSYGSERYIIENYKCTYNDIYGSSSCGFIFANTNPCKLFVLGNGRDYKLYFQDLELYIIPDGQDSLNISVYKGLSQQLSSDTSLNFSGTHLKISPNDKYIYDTTCNTNVRRFCVELDEHLSVKQFYSGVYLVSETYGKVIAYNSTYGGGPATLTFDNKTITLGGKTAFCNACFSPNEDNILVLAGTYNQMDYQIGTNTLRIDIYNTSDVLNAENGDTINPVSSFGLQNKGTSTSYILVLNEDGSLIRVFKNSYGSDLPEMWTLTSEVDEQTLVGIRYNGQVFRSVQSGILTATASDVVNGKTFIGNSGSVETGTAGNSV